MSTHQYPKYNRYDSNWEQSEQGYHNKSCSCDITKQEFLTSLLQINEKYIFLLYSCCTRRVLAQSGCVWTGEFDLRPLLVDVEMFEFGKKKLRIFKNFRIQMYMWTGPETCYAFSDYKI